MPSPVELMQAAAQERQLLGMSPEQQTQNTGVYFEGDALKIAQAVYGEVGHQPDKTVNMVASSIMNRLESSKEEFGFTAQDVVSSGKSPYYAVANNTPEYQEAASGQFSTPKGEEDFVRVLQIVNGLMRGTIPRHEAQFFFTGNEISGMKRKKKKDFDFKKVRETGKVGKYHTFSY